MFKQQIEKTLEVYIDNMVVKSKKADEHVLDLAKVFGILRHQKLLPSVHSKWGSRSFLATRSPTEGLRPTYTKSTQFNSLTY